MTARSDVPVGRMVWALIRNQPVRYGFSLTMWIAIWTMPILAGFIGAAFFDMLTDETAGSNVATLVAAMWAYVVARIGIVFIGMRLHSELLFRAGAGLRSTMLGWIFSLPGAQSIEETPGEVVSRFRDDVEHTLEALDFTVDLAGATVSAIIAVIILFTIDPVITLAVFTPLVAVILLVSRTGSTIRRYRRAARDSTEAITGFLGETFGSVQSIKVAGAEATMIDHFNELNEERRKMMVRDRTFSSALEAVFRNTVSIGTGLILVLAAGSLARGGDAGLTIGEFSLFVFLLAAVTESTYFIGMYIARLKQASVSAERMLLLMRGAEWNDLVIPHDLDGDGTPSHASAPASPRISANGAPLLSTNGLSFRYPSSGRGIKGVDLTVSSGDFVVVTGRIGAGKTTLLRTILGLLPADGGSISWHGAAVDDPATFMVPPRAAYTPQVPRLFSLTLGENLLLGLPIAEDELDRAIHTATMEDDLAAMPDGLQTMVGPRGVRLSGGQVQRSAAARMLAREPELFVFDDLSSALDVETEQKLWDRLFTDAGGHRARRLAPQAGASTRRSGDCHARRPHRGKRDRRRAAQDKPGIPPAVVRGLWFRVALLTERRAIWRTRGMHADNVRLDKHGLHRNGLHQRRVHLEPIIEAKDASKAETGEELCGALPDSAKANNADGEHRWKMERSERSELPAAGSSVVVVVVGSHQKGVAEISQYRFGPGVDRGEQRIHQIGDDHPDRQRPVGAQPAGQRMGSVVEPLGDLEHAHRGLLGDHRSRVGIERPRRR